MRSSSRVVEREHPFLLGRRTGKPLAPSASGARDRQADDSWRPARSARHRPPASSEVVLRGFIKRLGEGGSSTKRLTTKLSGPRSGPAASPPQGEPPPGVGSAP